MGTFERETVKRKPVGTLKLLVAIGLIMLAVNVLVQLLNLLPSGLNRAVSVVVIILSFAIVWKMIAHNGESFTYKISEEQGLLVIERQMGRSSTSFFSLNLREVIEIRAYDPDQDRKIPAKRRFTVSRHKSSWQVVSFKATELEKLIFEPSETFLDNLSTHIAREKVKS